MTKTTLGDYLYTYEPNFLIIGSQKCATSWLEHNLSKNTNIYMPNKQLHLFDFDSNPTVKLRKKLTSAAIIGEKTVENVLPTNLPKVIHWLTQNPNRKAILTLRDPYNRCVSAINHLAYSGRIKPYRDLTTFMKKVDAKVLNELLEFSNYPRILQQVYRCKLENQICILSFEHDIVKNPENGIKKALYFIDPCIETDKLELSSPIKNKRVAKEICYINSKLIKVKQLRKLTQMANDLLGLKPYKVEEDIEGRVAIHEYLKNFEWSAVRWQDVFETKFLPQWSILSDDGIAK